jgi:hypothetical protein
MVSVHSQMKRMTANTWGRFDETFLAEIYGLICNYFYFIAV